MTSMHPLRAIARHVSGSKTTFSRPISCRATNCATSIACEVEEAAGSRGCGISSTAFVHPAAVLGEDVYIGPFCTIGNGARIGNACQFLPGSHVFGDTEIGERCTIMTGAVIGAGIPGKTVIGNNNIIGHHAVIGVKCQDLKYKAGDECFLEVGDNNDIREFVSIHRSSKSDDQTVIGNGNLIMGGCHVAHDCKVGNYNIFANNTLLGGHVVVEDRITFTPQAAQLCTNFAIWDLFVSLVEVL